MKRRRMSIEYRQVTPWRESESTTLGWTKYVGCAVLCSYPSGPLILPLPRSNVARLWSNAKTGNLRPSFLRHRPKVVRHRPKFGLILCLQLAEFDGPNSVELGPDSVEIRPDVSQIGQLGWNSVQIWPGAARLCQTRNTVGRTLASLGPHLAESGPNLVNIGPSLGRKWPQVGRTWPQFGRSRPTLEG